jgi:hypothetical protein
MKRPNKLVLAAALAAFVAGGVYVTWRTSRVRKGYEPLQPIHFPHDRMAGEPKWETDENGEAVNVGGFGIPCMYCHTMAYKGRHSTVPSTDICMNCHSTVGQDKEWVLVMKDYWDRGEPIPWVKVHDLPDFVYYDHSVHLAAVDEAGKAKLDCVDCHGKVEERKIVRVEYNFNMGWCMDCHRKPEMNASIDCVTCHR